MPIYSINLIYVASSIDCTNDRQVRIVNHLVVKGVQVDARGLFRIMTQCLADGRGGYVQPIGCTGPAMPRRICCQRNGAVYHLAYLFQQYIHPVQGVQVLPPYVSSVFA